MGNDRPQDHAPYQAQHGPYLGPPIAIAFAVLLLVLLFGGILWRV